MQGSGTFFVPSGGKQIHIYAQILHRAEYLQENREFCPPAAPLRRVSGPFQPSGRSPHPSLPTPQKPRVQGFFFAQNRPLNAQKQVKTAGSGPKSPLLGPYKTENRGFWPLAVRSQPFFAPTGRLEAVFCAQRQFQGGFGRAQVPKTQKKAGRAGPLSYPKLARFRPEKTPFGPVQDRKPRFWGPSGAVPGLFCAQRQVEGGFVRPAAGPRWFWAGTGPQNAKKGRQSGASFLPKTSPVPSRKTPF